MRNLHIVGDFPISDSEATFVLQDEMLRRWLLRYAAGGITSGRQSNTEASFARAITDYATFKALREKGSLRRDSRMQISASPAVHFFSGPASDHRSTRFAADVDELNNELARHLARTAVWGSPCDLAIQIVLPFADFREASTTRPASKDEMQRGLVEGAVRTLDAIPWDAEAIVHFDCRDGARYKMRPDDMVDMVDISESLMRECRRPLTLIHMPVPLAHGDDSFFRGLDALQLSRSTRLCLGLIHLSDGLDGALRRIEFATVHFAEFDVAARSSFRARSPDQVREFLSLHALVAVAQSESNAKQVSS